MYMDMTLKARNDIHLARRLWHFCGVMCILALYWAVPPQRAGATALALSLPIIIMDTVRLFSRRWNKALTWLFWPFMRENERNRLAGLSFMLAGVTIIILLFNRHVVLLSLMF